MSLADWFSPILSFGGAALGAWLVYRSSKSQEWGQRFDSALELLATQDTRQQALGRARMIEISRQGSANRRREALTILRQDVRESCTEPVWQALSASDEGYSAWTTDDAQSFVEGSQVFVSRALVESALAYVDIAGGADAAPDPVVVAISQAGTRSDVWDSAASTEVARPPLLAPALPSDRRLLLIKLPPDAASLTPNDLRERTRKAWRLSIDRLKSEPPEGVAAVIQQRVRGAWKFQDAVPSVDDPGRVEFVLGDEIPALVGCEYREGGQNPVRYWP